MTDKVLGLIVLLAAPTAYLAARMQKVVKLRGHWVAMAVPPVLLILGAIWGVVLLTQGQSEMALLILFLALPVATAWVVLIQYMRDD
jgi:ABC-type glycerol-3-phosphate transport system permease component